MHAAAGRRACERGSGSDSTSAGVDDAPGSPVLELLAATARMGVDEAEAARLTAASPSAAASVAEQASMSGEGGGDATKTPAEPAAGIDLPPRLPELWHAIARCDGAKHPACTGIPVRALSAGLMMLGCSSRLGRSRSRPGPGLHPRTGRLTQRCLARAALAAEGGTLQASARLSCVSVAWRDALRGDCAQALRVHNRLLVTPARRRSGLRLHTVLE